jgi:hypothetical protein
LPHSTPWLEVESSPAVIAFHLLLAAPQNRASLQSSTRGTSSKQLFDTDATMTKIWCPLCHKSEFDVSPPTQRTVMEHVRDAHGYNTGQGYLAERTQLRKRQNREWENRRSKLSDRLDANARQMRRQYEDFADAAKGKEVPENTTDPELQQQWMQLMEIHDDSEDEEEAVVVNPDHVNRVDAYGVERAMAAPRSAGQRYPTIADRTTQATTIVERTTAGGLRQQMLIPANSQGVGWHTMAETGFTPCGAREMREDRQDQNDGRSQDPTQPGGLNDQFPEIQSTGGGGSPDAVEAASILVAMRTSQAPGAVPQAGDLRLQHTEEDVEAATALEKLLRGRES